MGPKNNLREFDFFRFWGFISKLKSSSSRSRKSESGTSKVPGAIFKNYWKSEFGRCCGSRFLQGVSLEGVDSRLKMCAYVRGFGRKKEIWKIFTPTHFMAFLSFTSDLLWTPLAAIWVIAFQVSIAQNDQQVKIFWSQASKVVQHYTYAK